MIGGCVSRGKKTSSKTGIIQKNGTRWGKNKMNLKELYEQIGGNYQETLSRLPSETMVKKFVIKYAADPTFGELKKALEEKDWETAFRAAHTLKGVAQNLGFQRLYTAAYALTEQLRGNQPLTDRTHLEEVEKAHQTILNAVAQLA